MELRHKIKLAIEAASITSKKVADRLGRSEAYVSQLLSGARELTDAKALEIMVKALHYRPSEANSQISAWRIEEYTKNLRPELSSVKPVRLKISDELSLPVSVDETVEFPSLFLKDGGEYFVYRTKSFRGRVAGGVFWLLIRRTTEYCGPKIHHVFTYGNTFDIGEIIETSGFFEPKNYPKVTKDSPDFSVIGVVEGIFEKTV